MSNKKSREEVTKKNHLNDLTGTEWVKHSISWFTLKTRARTSSELRHPGKFPEGLAERFIRLFTKREQWVIDPFLGVGSTLLASRKLERNGVGIEINPRFAKSANSALDQQVLFPVTSQKVICGDSLNLRELLKSHFGANVPRFDLCMTSPPYWNMLQKHRGGSDSQHRQRKERGLPLVYSNDIESDISNIVDYKAYLDTLVNVFKELKPLMKHNGHVVVVLQNIRDEEGEFVPIAWDFSSKIKELFRPRQEQIWCQTDKKTGIWGYPTSYVANVHHHYCLIFQNV